MLSPPIIMLFLCSGPAAVARLIAKIAVDAIQSPPWRTMPHIGKEVLKAFPMFADRDPACPVVTMILSVWIRIQTTLLHGNPTPVRAREAHSVLWFSCFAQSRASATCASASREIAPGNYPLLAARTATQVKDSTQRRRSICGSLNDGPPTKRLSGQINHSHLADI